MTYSQPRSMLGAERSDTRLRDESPALMSCVRSPSKATTCAPMLALLERHADRKAVELCDAAQARRQPHTSGVPAALPAPAPRAARKPVGTAYGIRRGRRDPSSWTVPTHEVNVSRVVTNSLPLIGQGRGCLVYDLGDGTVLRRYRNPSQSAEAEAAAMRRAAQAGLAVPRVHDVSGSAIRMDRVDGPTMADQLAEHPEQAGPSGHLLADLHHALDGTGSRGFAVVHGDLHPGNVVMSADGPVLIDWTNHRSGPRALDVALTWLLLDCFDPDDDALRIRLGSLRGEFLRSFLEAMDASAAAAALPEAGAIRRADPATTSEEHSRINHLLSVVGAESPRSSAERSASAASGPSRLSGGSA